MATNQVDHLFRPPFCAGVSSRAFPPPPPSARPVHKVRHRPLLLLCPLFFIFSRPLSTLLHLALPRSSVLLLNRCLPYSACQLTRRCSPKSSFARKLLTLSDPLPFPPCPFALCSSAAWTRRNDIPRQPLPVEGELPALETAVGYEHTARTTSDIWSPSICHVLISSIASLEKTQGFSFPRKHHPIIMVPRFTSYVPSLRPAGNQRPPTHTHDTRLRRYVLSQAPSRDQSQDTKRHPCSETGVTSSSPQKGRAAKT